MSRTAAVIVALASAFLLTGGWFDWLAGRPWTYERARLDFNGEYRHDMCLCFRNGYDAGRSGLEATSADYATMFETCGRRIAPPTDGQAAWTDGYSAGATGAGPRSCRRYLASRAQ